MPNLGMFVNVFCILKCLVFIFIIVVYISVYRAILQLYNGTSVMSVSLEIKPVAPF